MELVVLKPCKWRSEPEPEQYSCSYPGFLGAPFAVTARNCQGCSRCNLRPTAPARQGPDSSKSLNCIHLGRELRLQECKTCKGHTQVKIFACAIHGECTVSMPIASGKKICWGCADRQFSRDFQAKPNDPLCGVVVGAYFHVPLIELQIRVIRAYCGQVPILISDDHSPDGRSESMARICSKYHDVDFVTSYQRIGHAGGDLAAFSRGVLWAHRRGLKVLAKVSNRWLCVVPRWLQDGAIELLRSGRPFAGDRCIDGRVRAPLRTDACLLDVAKWHTADAINRMNSRPGGSYFSEGTINQIRLTFGKDSLLIWPLLHGPHRFLRAPGVLWHQNTSEAEFRDLGKKFGVDLGPEFRIDGSNFLPNYKQ